MENTTEFQADAAAVVKKDRVCDFYLTPRGCVKGDACDFQHPNAPGGAVTNKVCQFFQTPRGCIKGAACDFLHPEGMTARAGGVGQGAAKQAVCNFFNSPRGCIKGDKCDFLHPGAQAGMGMMGQMGAMGGMGAYGGYGMGMGMGMEGFGAPMMGVTGGQSGNGKPCQYFSTPRGCIKGNACDFSHTGGAPQMGGFGRGMSPMGPVNKMGQLMKDKVCDFFNTEKGCIKADACEFIHQKQKPCEFFASARGCKKGAFCDFQHEGEGGATEGAGKVAKSSGSARFAPY